MIRARWERELDLLRVSEQSRNALETRVMIDLISDNMYWQVTSFPRMRSPNSINFIMDD